MRELGVRMDAQWKVLEHNPGLDAIHALRLEFAEWRGELRTERALEVREEHDLDRLPRGRQCRCRHNLLTGTRQSSDHKQRKEHEISHPWLPQNPYYGYRRILTCSSRSLVASTFRRKRRPVRCRRCCRPRRRPLAGLEFVIDDAILRAGRQHLQGLEELDHRIAVVGRECLERLARLDCFTR